MNLQDQYTKRGYSLIELILVIAILSFVSIGFLGFGSNFLNSNKIENATNEIISSLRQAQLNSMAGKEDSRWGVDTTAAGVIKLYADGDPAFDQTYTYSASSLNVTSFNVLFDKITGNPTVQSGPALGQNIAISDSTDSEILTINKFGIIDIN